MIHDAKDEEYKLINWKLLIEESDTRICALIFIGICKVKVHREKRMIDSRDKALLKQNQQSILGTRS